jgi:hypothetical protein
MVSLSKVRDEHHTNPLVAIPPDGCEVNIPGGAPATICPSLRPCGESAIYCDYGALFTFWKRSGAKMLSLASSKCVTKFRTVLIILCIIFPPIIPFVLLYYVFGNRGANRRNARATERLVSAEQEANIIRFAGLSPEQRNQVLEAKHQANAQHIRNNLIAVTVVILMVGIFVLHRSPRHPLFHHLPSLPNHRNQSTLPPQNPFRHQ